MKDSNKKLTFIEELLTLLRTVRFGSIEIYVQDHIVTQLTVRNIKKTKVDIHKEIKAEKPNRPASPSQ